nr:hypothetical protein [Tanacetum cinerariifolium]
MHSFDHHLAFFQITHSFIKKRLTESEVESDEDVSGIDARVQDEGQARPNPGEQDEGQARPNPGDAAVPDFPYVHRPLQAMTTETTTTTTYPPPPQPQQSTTDSMLMKRINELKQIMVNLIQHNKHLKERDFPEADMKEILRKRMWETNSYKTHKDHMMLYEALEKSMNRDHTDELLKDLAEAHKRRKRDDLLELLDHHKCYHHLLHLHPPTRKAVCLIDPEDLHIDDDMAPDAQAHSFDNEDIENAHIPTVNLRQDWWKPLEEDRPATLEPAWFIPSSDYQMEECHKLLTDSVDDSIIRHNVSKPLPLGGPPGQVTIQFDFFFNKDLEYLTYGSKGSRLSILKMKAAYYPDVGLEQMVPDQMWIEEECKHTSEGDHRAVRTHMRILSVVRIEVFSMYG